ncbi:MAG: C1 family peptidase [Sphingobacteriaceae bacterium]|nr:C1 family peptidase [Cytophagaceae bacterium]
MAKRQREENSMNGANGYSGFGGHLLAAPTDSSEGVRAISSAEDALLQELAALGIEDAEQLVAIVSIPGIREELESVLGSTDGALEALLDQAASSLPTERAALVSNPAPRDLGLGALPPTQEMVATAERSMMASADIEAISLPAAINLIPFFQPIRSQGPRGTCVAYTLTALNEYILRRRGFVRNLSEQHLYYETKLIDGIPASCGTYQAKAVLPLLSKGECLETIWPYNPSMPCNNHGPRPANARPNGLNQRLSTVAVPARNVAAYKLHMSKQRPVTISIPVYNSWYQSQETRRSGRITMRIGNEPVVGGHAVCLVGYQDTPGSPGGGYFLVRNSWGTAGFGYESPYGAGYGTIPYQYITNYAYLGESFTAIVPGIQTEEDTGEESTEANSATTVTIEVKPNITITISST